MRYGLKKFIWFKQNATLGSFVPFAMSALFCQYLQSNDWSTVCFLVMMVSKSAFWFSVSCLPAPLPLWATSCRGSWEQAADWNVIRQSEFVFQLCTLVSIPTLRVFSYSPPCSSHSSSHGIVYSALPGVIRQSRFYIVCTWSVRSSDVIMVLMYPASYKHSRPGALFKSTLFSKKKTFWW